MIKPSKTHTLAFKGLRIGLLGGSFNPAHQGHLDISLYALGNLVLDQIWWLVSPQNPLKSTDNMLSLADRMKGAEELAAPYSSLVVTDIEEQLGCIYTIDTLTQLKALMPETHFLWLMGADNLENFHKWHRWQDIFRTVPIAVFRRPRYDCTPFSGVAAETFSKDWKDETAHKNLVMLEPPAWTTLDNPENTLSATQIREAKKQDNA